MKIKIIFLGSAEFGAIILEQLIRETADEMIIAGAITQPDKPVGRKQTLSAQPVKILAVKNKIPIWQPEKFDDKITDELQKKEADIFIVAAYGKIIPAAILNIPKYGCLNIHPSLLPKYRGPAPIQYALFNGDKETGVTIIKLDEKMDHGAIVNYQSASINGEDNYLTLSRRLAAMGTKLLVKTIPDYLTKKIQPREQNHKQSTYTRIIDKKDGLIDWQKNASQIYNQWRAYIIWPGIFTKFKNQELKCKIKVDLIKLLEIKICKEKITDTQRDLGKFFVLNSPALAPRALAGKKLLVKCGQGSHIEILKLQPEGKKEMAAGSFINGYMK
jgi:methionyl-tRNA formyltransferase